MATNLGMINITTTLPGCFLRQGVHRRGSALHGRVGSCLWTAGGEPLGGVHGDRTHRKAHRDSLHGLLEGGRREDCGQLGLRRLPPCDGSIGEGCLRGERVGSLRPRRTRSTRARGKIKTTKTGPAYFVSGSWITSLDKSLDRNDKHKDKCAQNECFTFHFVVENYMTIYKNLRAVWHTVYVWQAFKLWSEPISIFYWGQRRSHLLSCPLSSQRDG